MTSCEYQPGLNGAYLVDVTTTIPDDTSARSTRLLGEMLLFRGDCWHAGAGYTTKNRRIHFYLSSPQRRRVPAYSFPYVWGLEVHCGSLSSVQVRCAVVRLSTEEAQSSCSNRGIPSVR